MDDRSLVSAFVLVLMLGASATYLLRSMYLMERDSHEGPFRSRIRYVRFPDTGHVQHVALFDWIRRLAGAYEVKGYQWTVREGDTRSERFTCPYCLSFWTSMPFTAIFFLLGPYKSGIELLMVIAAHFGIAIISQVIFKALWGDD